MEREHIREMLFRFFEGVSNLEEEKSIREWIGASEENHKHFMQERLAYDLWLMAEVDTDSNNAHTEEKKTFRMWPWAGRVAAAAVVLLALYVWKFQDVHTEKYSTLIVPPGQRIHLILEDSTTVWLNANTIFRYPSAFAKKNRTVHLDGEAYFEVTKNADKPFIVKTQQGDVRVTGTKFNVQAYNNTNLFETSLFEGGVDLYRNNIKLISLKPNEKSTIIGNKVSKTTIDGMEAYLWRKGLIAFKDNKIEEVFAELSQRFNIKIEVRSQHLSKETYTGKFRQADGVEYALKVLQQSVRFSYHRDADAAVIYITKP